MISLNNSILSSILFVDDDGDALNLYCHLLAQHLNAKIVPSKFPTQAISLATDMFFDIIILDVTMNYHGSPFGGLELYKELLNRYGKESLIAYSQFITDDLLKQYNYNFNFIEKGTDPIAFIETLSERIHNLRKKQSCFIAMPFDRKYDALYDVIKSCVEDHDYQCVRLDKEVFTKSIVEKMFDEIRKCKLVIFVSTGKNPNAFYECGFAIALNKEVVTITDFYKNLPFDIRDRNAIEYKDDLSKLEQLLRERLDRIIKAT